MDYNWDFAVLWKYQAVFLRGVLLTAYLTLLATAIGVLLGLGLAFLRSAR